MSPAMLLLVVISLLLDKKNYAFNDTAINVVTVLLYMLFKYALTYYISRFCCQSIRHENFPNVTCEQLFDEIF